MQGECPVCTEEFGGGGLGGPNVRWSVSDSVAACPAGDSVVVNHPTHAHPSRLRISFEYFDSECAPNGGVPPDSIWVTYTTSSGNVVVNDQRTRIFADDSTTTCGVAQITVPSLSGCGVLNVNLFISGVDQGGRAIVVRTADTNADGRITNADAASPCDLNYDGASGSADASLLLAHADHWRRNALHGTLVQRTNLYYGEHQPGSYGGSEVFWSPSGRWLSYTVHALSGNACTVWIVPSDPAIGDQPKQFSWVTDSSDYDPSWSPLNTEIAFGRADYRIVRKGIPGLASDTTEQTVAVSGTPDDHGDLTPSISPNGQWAAFARKNQATLDFHIWKAPIAGGPATQLTFTAGCNDQYPNWSPDGQWITFDREIGFPNEHNIYKVKANQAAQADTTTFAVYRAPAGTDAAWPGYSPDGLIITGALGTHSSSVFDVRTHTIDPALATPKPILNYADTAFAVHGPHPGLSPRISPDGTRLALAARQVWAGRRNMNLPPVFTTVTSGEDGTRSIADTAATMSFRFDVVSTNFITVLATDTEGDALTYQASFLKSWMTWNQETRTLTATNIPPAVLGKTFYVKFWVTTPSGGTDSFIAAIEVTITLGMAQVAASHAAESEGSPRPANPTSGEFASATPPLSGVTARLLIFDLAGRRVARISGPSGSTLVWDGRDERSGALAAPGVYFYRMEAGDYRRDGKIAVVR